MPLSEFSLIDRYFAGLGDGPDVVLGVGDDCALLCPGAGERLAVSVDTMVQGVHFPPTAPPADIAYRAVAAAASDLAAVGARPLGMTLALTLPSVEEAWLQAFAAGVAAAALDLALPLVGGDTTRGPMAVSVQVMGALPGDRALLRSGARAGDAVYVSGTLGDAAAALALARGEWHTTVDHARFLHSRFYRPAPRLALGRQLLGLAHAAIDVSDGLAADAGHVAAASGVRIEIDTESLPISQALASHPDRSQVLRWALTGGDDYELFFCLPAGASPPSGTRVGRVLAGQGVDCRPPLADATGYDHFAAAPASRSAT